MRPRPIKLDLVCPQNIVCLREILPYGLLEGRRRHVGVEMHAQDTPPALSRHVEITAR